ncbi:MAG TPA: DUF5715 family protein [Longimicrobiales bacterium]|nr:DUF5715 family protein [Longimicrobiales bacterium]
MTQLLRRMMLAGMLMIATAACTQDDDAPATQTNDLQPDPATSRAIEAPGPDLDAATAARVRTALDTRLSETGTAVQRLPGLIGSIRRDMRRYVNDDHVAAAQRSGVGPVRDSAHVARLLDSDALVALPDSSEWWVLRELDQSLPYVTPHTREILEELGRRFHARLQEHGLPPFRFDITSVLRTEEQQEALRRRNRNASRTTSSHEFGTTFDIAYLSFAAPRVIADPPAGRLDARLRAYATMRLDTLGTHLAPHLEGELGAVLQEMQREGTLLTLRERSQPVYHTTVVRR